LELFEVSVNLIDMLRRQDPALQADPNVAVKIIPWNQDKWRVLEVQQSDEPQLMLRNLARVNALKSRPQDLGWHAQGPVGGSLSMDLVGSERSLSRRLRLSESPAVVELPWPDRSLDCGEVTELSLHFNLAPGGVARLYVQRVMDRQILYDLAKGRGVEIGPGARPQIIPSEDVQVAYVEEKTGEYWSTVYDRHGKWGAAKMDWSKYIIGQASDLPVGDASLDFVFSSHVFEHLANPLGHLVHWKAKLKKSGVILAVVPNMDCTKDWCAIPTSLEELRNEFGRQIWVPEISHYEHYVKVRGIRSSAHMMMDEKQSIHVHFYNEQTIKDLLEECVSSYGFSKYDLMFSRNHKDFYYALWA
jgi:SAM-dependent methyltransferase